MLYTNNGRTSVTGNAIEVLVDLTMLINAVKESFEKSGLSEEFINENIAMCGRLAFMSSEEVSSLKDDMTHAAAEKYGVDTATIDKMVAKALEEEKED